LGIFFKNTSDIHDQEIRFAAFPKGYAPPCVPEANHSKFPSRKYQNLVTLGLLEERMGGGSTAMTSMADH